MHRSLITLAPATSLWEAARQMQGANVTMLPVCAGTVLIGVLTARDLTMRATAEGCDPFTSQVRDVMTRDIVSVRDDLEIQQAMGAVQRCQAPWLPVLNRRGELVGTIDLADLLRAVSQLQ